MVSRFIPCQHPVSSVVAKKSICARMERNGWLGQRKIGIGTNSFRSQIHLDSSGVIAHYTGGGFLFDRSDCISSNINLCKAFEPLCPDPHNGINVFDAEWIPQLDKVFIFDLLKYQDDNFDKLTYIQRYEYLNIFMGNFIDHPHIQFLSVYKTAYFCWKELNLIKKNKDPFCEGLVFRSSQSIGWNDSAIVCCITSQ